jgi:hypothetical protein
MGAATVGAACWRVSERPLPCGPPNSNKCLEISLYSEPCMLSQSWQCMRRAPPMALTLAHAALHASMERARVVLRVLRALGKQPEARNSIDVSVVAAETEAYSAFARGGPGGCRCAPSCSACDRASHWLHGSRTEHAPARPAAVPVGRVAVGALMAIARVAFEGSSRRLPCVACAALHGPGPPQRHPETASLSPCTCPNPFVASRPAQGPVPRRAFPKAGERGGGRGCTGTRRGGVGHRERARPWHAKERHADEHRRQLPQPLYVTEVVRSCRFTVLQAG